MTLNVWNLFLYTHLVTFLIPRPRKFCENEKNGVGLNGLKREGKEKKNMVGMGRSEQKFFLRANHNGGVPSVPLKLEESIFLCALVSSWNPTWRRILHTYGRGVTLQVSVFVTGLTPTKHNFQPRLTPPITYISSRDYAWNTRSLRSDYNDNYSQEIWTKMVRKLLSHNFCLQKLRLIGVCVFCLIFEKNDAYLISLHIKYEIMWQFQKKIKKFFVVETFDWESRQNWQNLLFDIKKWVAII